VSAVEAGNIICRSWCESTETEEALEKIGRQIDGWSGFGTMLAAMSRVSTRSGCASGDVGPISGRNCTWSGSLTGVDAYFGVGFKDDSTDDASGDRYREIWWRPWAVSSAASSSDRGDAFFLVLNANLGRGANEALVSASFSCSALIACEYGTGQ
jgi:hypothetical protein